MPYLKVLCVWVVFLCQTWLRLRRSLNQWGGGRTTLVPSREIRCSYEMPGWEPKRAAVPRGVCVQTPCRSALARVLTQFCCGYSKAPAVICLHTCSAPRPPPPLLTDPLCILLFIFYFIPRSSDPEAVSCFSELFWSSKLAHISTLDFLVLSAVIVDPIREDMRRRGVEPEPAKVALFSIPLVGPALWMLVRPPVES